MTPPFMKTSVRSAKFATATVNAAVADGALLVTSKVPGAFGNRISVEVIVNEETGPPVFSINGHRVTLAVSSRRTFEASGPFYFNGSGVTTFLTLWWVGDFDGKPRWAQDGLPFSWPIDRDGEFTIFANDAWNMVQVQSGAIRMHWKSDFPGDDVNLIPAGEKSAENPYGWYGAIPACTGWVSSHYGAHIDEVANLPYLIETGIPENALVPDPVLNARVQFSIPGGQAGTGYLQTSSPLRLSGA